MPSRFSLSIGVVALLVLLVRFMTFITTPSNLADGQTRAFTTTIRSTPTILEKFQRFSFVTDEGNRITVMVPLYPQLHYGDTVHLEGVIKAPSKTASTQQRAVLAPEKPVFTMFFPTVTITQPPLFLTPLVWFRNHTTTLFQTTLPPTAASLLLGIVFGIKEGMPKEFMTALSQGGVIHVIAASGMNVTMVAAFLSSLFAFFFRRQVALVASIVGILLYGLLSGFEPSIMRASLMAILAFSAQILGRQNKAFYGLFLAGFFMLFFTPQLLFDIGFQLSFASTLGLLSISPLLTQHKRVQELIDRSFIGQDIVTTTTAQLATLPILLANFGTYSLWSIVVNGLVLWVVPPLMVIGGLAALIGLLLPFMGQLLLYLALPFLWYFEQVVRFFAGRGILQIDGLSFPILVGYYLVLVSLLLFLLPRYKEGT